MLDQHKTTCYHCGENTGKPAVLNQYPLCDTGIGKGWKNKPFTIIAKQIRGKKAKLANVIEKEVEGEAKEGDFDNDIEDFRNNVGLGDEIIDEEKEEVDEEDNEVDDEAENGVQSDLVSGSKKRNKKSKKTRSGFVSSADDQFIHMHGRGDFSSLPCNDFSNVDFLLREDNKGRNLNAKKNK